MTASIFDLIGNTPLVEIKNLSPNPGVRIFAKLESCNPGGSVKDRAASSMIIEAEKRNLLYPGIHLIEPTSGNTGIALALICALKGYHIELVMPENSTKERIQLMKAYGAKVTLTPAEKTIEGSIDYVNEKIEKSEDLYRLNQFANPDNPLAHYRTTGPEIWKDTQGEVTHFISAMGTTGTVMGVSRFLKEQNSDIQIIGVQPAEGSSIAGIRRWPEEYMPAIFEKDRVDRTMEVSTEESEEMARQMAEKEGILCGVSSGGAMAVTLRVAAEIETGTLVSIVCDTGERYLSSKLFSGYDFDQSDEEINEKGYTRKRKFLRSGIDQIHVQTLKKSESKYRLIISHGYSECGYSYRELAEEFLEHGAEVVLFDFPGHGESTGIRGNAKNFDTLRICLETVLQETFKGDSLPTFMLAHSMSGLISMHAMKNFSEKFQGLIFLSPLFGFDPGYNLMLRAFSGFLCLIGNDPETLIPKFCDTEILTRDSEERKKYAEDPYKLHTGTQAFVRSLWEGLKTLPLTLKYIQCPSLFLQGTDDKLVYPNALMRIFKKIPRGDKSLIFFAEAKHELLKEINREEVKQNIFHFIEKHSPSNQ